MTVTELRKLLIGVDGSLELSFESDDLPDASWSVDAVEERFNAFLMLKSVCS